MKRKRKGMKLKRFREARQCQSLQIRVAAAKSLQSCPTLCDPIDGSPPGSPVPGILQARILEWVAISLSSAWKWKIKVKSLSRVRLLATPWTAAYQAPPSMGFSRQGYWSGVPLPSPADQGKELFFPHLSDDHFKITNHIMPSLFLKLIGLPTTFVIKPKEWHEKKERKGTS